jgi:acyl carrier protein
MLNTETATLIRTYIVDTFLFGDSSAIMADDASLLELGIINSTGMLDLMMFMEETFGIQVLDGDVVPENFDSVASLARYADAKRVVAA